MVERNRNDWDITVEESSHWNWEHDRQQKKSASTSNLNSFSLWSRHTRSISFSHLQPNVSIILVCIFAAIHRQFAVWEYECFWVLSNFLLWYSKRRQFSGSLTIYRNPQCFIIILWLFTSWCVCLCVCRFTIWVLRFFPVPAWSIFHIPPSLNNLEKTESERETERRRHTSTYTHYTDLSIETVNLENL